MYIRTNIIIFCCVLVSLFSGVYAIDSIRVYIDATQTTGTHSYPTQTVTTQIGLSVINNNNDILIPGDYLVGEYYDTAHGFFSFHTYSSWVFISSTGVNDCTDNISHIWYKLGGYSQSDNFGIVDFSYNLGEYVYICIPRDENSDENGYIWGRAYSEYIWYQSFDDITFDFFVDRTQEHLSEARYVKVDGMSSSKTVDYIDLEAENELRVLWNITKSSIRKDFLQWIYALTRWLTTPGIYGSLSSLGLEEWTNTSGWSVLMGGDLLYFSDLWWDTLYVNVENNIEGSKTLVVEWGNIYITWNIRNTDNDAAILGMVALHKNGVGWNIYIDPTVTDIHANIYADRSMLNYSNGVEIPGSEVDSALANQLYIYGSVFSENTIGGASDVHDLSCPFYISDACSESLAKKYDFNYLRRYILVSEIDTNGHNTWLMYPNYNAAEAYMWNISNQDTNTQKPWYRVYPLIIEYNPAVQSSPPPLF